MSNQEAGDDAFPWPFLTSLLRSDPLFAAYAQCVLALCLKMTFVAWTTVYLMISNDGRGMKNQEDLLRGPCNPHPKPDVQMQPFEPTERQRRIMNHDLENNVPFFMVGWLYVIAYHHNTDVGADGQWNHALPLYMYTVLKMIHHLVYWSAQRHEIRATIWTMTNGCFLYMCYKVGVAVGMP